MSNEKTKLKASDLLSPAVIESFAELKGMSLPIKLSYAISKSMKAIDSELKILNEKRNEILTSNAEKTASGKIVEQKDPSGKPIPNTVKIKDTEKYIKEINELSELDIEVSIHKLSIKDIEETAELNIKPEVFLNLEFLFTE